MNIWLQIVTVLMAAAGCFALALRFRPRRDVCQPLTNQERLLRYIERRAAWECEQRKRKLLQRQRVERMLEQRYLRHAPRSKGSSLITLPPPRAAA